MRKEITVQSSKNAELIDITSQVRDFVKQAKIKEGLCNVYTGHATCGIIINENYDPNICIDFLKAFEQAFPNHNDYLHDRVDNNAGAHIKASIIGPSQTIPIKNSELLLGTWQAIMLADFDGPKSRRIILTAQ